LADNCTRKDATTAPATLATTDLDSTETTGVNQRAMNVKSLTVSEKCTWVAYSVKTPPAFAFSKGVGSTVTAGYDLDNTIWVVHHMEYSTLGA